MANNHAWQIWQNIKPAHQRIKNNTELTQKIAKLLLDNTGQRHKASTIASDLDLPLARVKNWIYKDTGMTAHDLMRILWNYDFVRDFLHLAPKWIDVKNRGNKTGNKFGQILHLYIKEHTDESIYQMANHLKVPIGKIKYHITRLKVRGQIGRAGARKNGVWVWYE
jgi:hypothetical protein